MRRRTIRHAAALALLLAASGIAPRSAAAAPPPTPIFCGQSVFESIRADNDLPNCPLNGLIVAEDGITIDLNGHTIDGNSADNDAGVEYGVGTTSGFPHSDVRVVNGTVTGFEAGINFDGGKNLVVKTIRSRGNGEGIRVSGTDVTGVALSQNALWENSSDGIQADHTPGIKATGNVATGNGDEGLDLEQLGGPVTVKDNVASGNGETGVLVHEATGGLIANNDTSRNGVHGISLGASTEVLVKGNLVARNTDVGILLGGVDGAIVKKNTSLGNGNEGISLFGTTDVQVLANTSSGNGSGIAAGISFEPRIVGNAVAGNRIVGILVEATDGEVGGNVASGNGFGVKNGTGLGIDASSTTGLIPALNTAKGNDDESECDPDLLCRDNSPPSKSKLPLTSVGCGEEITKSIRVDNDLSNCPLNGLIAAKSGITIDLNGHTVDGDGGGTEAGIYVGDVNGVTVANGLVTGFEDGIGVAFAKHVTIRKVLSSANEDDGVTASASSGLKVLGGMFVKNGGDGVHADSGSGLVIKGITAAGNGTGLTVVTSPGASVARNVVAGNGDGLSIDQSTGSHVTGGTFSGNGAYGIRVAASPSTVISKSISGGNGTDGIEVVTSDKARLSHDVISGNGGTGAVQSLSHQSEFAGNRASGNGGDGIDTHGASYKRIIGNAAHGNGGDGITTIGVSVVTIDRNAAHGNGFVPPGTGNDIGRGIQGGAPPASFSGNAARGNDDPTQCGTLIGPLVCS